MINDCDRPLQVALTDEVPHAPQNHRRVVRREHECRWRMVADFDRNALEAERSFDAQDPQEPQLALHVNFLTC